MVRVVVPASEAILVGSMLVASHGQMATDSAPRRSERVTQQPARLIHAVEVYVAPTTPPRNVACERKAVTAEMWAIGLRPAGKQMLLKRVSASRAQSAIEAERTMRGMRHHGARTCRQEEWDRN